MTPNEEVKAKGAAIHKGQTIFIKKFYLIFLIKMGIESSKPFDKNEHKKSFKDNPYCNSFISDLQGEYFSKYCCLDQNNKRKYFDDCLDKQKIISGMIADGMSQKDKEEAFTAQKMFGMMLYNGGCDEKDTEFATYRNTFNCQSFLNNLPKDKPQSKNNNMIMIGVIILIILIVGSILIFNKKNKKFKIRKNK